MGARVGRGAKNYDAGGWTGLAPLYPPPPWPPVPSQAEQGGGCGLAGGGAGGPGWAGVDLSWSEEASLERSLQICGTTTI